MKLRDILFIAPQTLLFAIVFIALPLFSVNAQHFEYERIAPKYEEFSIDIPKTDHIDVGRKRSALSYIIQSGNTHIFLFGYDEKDSELVQFVSDFLATGKETAVKSSNTSMAFDIVDFEGDDQFLHKIIFVKTEKRSYIFQFATLSSEKHLVDRIVKSIRFDNQPEQLSAFEDKESINLIERKSLDLLVPPPIIPSSIPVKTPAKEQIDKTGSTPRDDSAPAISTNGCTANYKILEKPRAEYPFFARTYGVQGVVRVRVNLYKDGLSISATAVTRQPFGLTKAAVEAANKIKFTPRLKGDQPISVSVAVDYSFHIY